MELQPSETAAIYGTDNCGRINMFPQVRKKSAACCASIQFAPGTMTDSLFEIRSGRGRKSRFKDVESQIVEEIERGNYQTLQQIADMVQGKFGINASIMAVSRLLKKRNPQAKGWLNTRQRRCCETAQLL